jgi:hypothetical protein
VIRQLAWLAGGVVVLWLLTLYPADVLWGAFGLGCTSFAAGVCFVTAALTLFLAERVRQQAPNLFRLALLANGGLRMTMVLAAGLLVTVAVLPKFPGSDPIVFWLSLLVFYLYTLVLETVLLLRGTMRRREP